MEVVWLEASGGAIVKLSEIVYEILQRTGQYIVAPTSCITDLAELQLNMTAIWSMVNRELIDYQKYKPLTKRFNLTITQQTYDFSNDIFNEGNGPPAWIEKVVPVGWLLMVSRAVWFTPSVVRDGSNITHRVIDPQTFLWQYIPDWHWPGDDRQVPMLTISQVGLMDVSACYAYQYIYTYDKAKKLVDVEIPELDHLAMPLLFDLLAAKFMMMVGRSRRAFTYNDLPITTDAVALVTEGTEQYKECREGLYNRGDWWRGITV